MARDHFLWSALALERALATSRRAGREPLARIHLHSFSAPVGCHGGDQRDNFRVHKPRIAHAPTSGTAAAANDTTAIDTAACATVANGVAAKDVAAKDVAAKDATANYAAANHAAANDRAECRGQHGQVRKGDGSKPSLFLPRDSRRLS
jgi:hypothetical protein